LEAVGAMNHQAVLFSKQMDQAVLIDGECIYADVAGCKWVYGFGYTLESHTVTPKAMERYQTHEKYQPNEG